MAHFLFLLHPAGSELERLTTSEQAALLAKFVAWSNGLHSRGQLVSIERLMMGAAGSTVRKRRDEIVVDGPYTEAKECVSGFLVVEAPAHADAERLAAECPLVQIGGAVEVREIDPTFPSPGR